MLDVMRSVQNWGRLMARRVTIGGMMVAIGVFALGFYALRSPSELSATIVVNMTAILAVAATTLAWRQRGGRVTWAFSFSLFLWLGLVFRTRYYFPASVQGWILLGLYRADAIAKLSNDRRFDLLESVGFANSVIWGCVLGTAYYLAGAGIARLRRTLVERRRSE